MSYKETLALDNITLNLEGPSITGIIGPNGAGKTTLFNLLTGVYEPSEGTITLDGTVLNGKAPYKIASLGLSRTFQNIRLFKDMTVLENVLVGLSNKQPSNFFASLLRLPKYYSSEEELKAKAMEHLGYLQLGWRGRYTCEKLGLRTTTSFGNCSCTCNRTKNSFP